MLRRVYSLVLRLYPDDFRVRFAREMEAAFALAWRDAADSFAVRRIAFGARELSGLLRGVCAEWLSKAATDAATRARRLPDCRRMRPAGVTRQEWGAGLENDARQANRHGA